MKRLPTLTLIAAGLLVSLGSGVFAQTRPASRDRSVLLPPEQAILAHPWGLEVNEAAWAASVADITEMEANFDKLKVLKPEQSCCLYRKWTFAPNDYFMQYSAVLIESRRYIYISARKTHGPWEKVWRTEFVWPPKGGGYNYWQALYDPETKTFSHLRFNGDE